MELLLFAILSGGTAYTAYRLGCHFGKKKEKANHGAELLRMIASVSKYEDKIKKNLSDKFEAEMLQAKDMLPHQFKERLFASEAKATLVADVSNPQQLTKEIAALKGMLNTEKANVYKLNCKLQVYQNQIDRILKYIIEIESNKCYSGNRYSMAIDIYNSLSDIKKMVSDTPPAKNNTCIPQ